MSLKDTAVIVINYNGKHFLKECFDSLSVQSYKGFEAFLLDNCSSDGSRDYVRSNFPNINIIELDKNYGFAQGYNKAINSLSIDFKYVVCLNNDVRVDGRWLEYLVAAAKSNDEAAIVGSKLYFYDRPGIVNSAGIVITPVGIGADVGFGMIDSEQFRVERFMAAVCGAGMLIKRDIFSLLAGFDESYFMYGEDVDLCWRACLRGYKVLYVPKAVVYHHFGGTAGKRETPFRIYYMQINSFRNIIKNYGFFNAVKGVFLLSLFFLARAVRFLAGLRFDNFFALLKAGFVSLSLMPELLNKRRQIQSLRKISDKQMKDRGYFASFGGSVKEYFRVQKV